MTNGSPRRTRPARPAHWQPMDSRGSLGPCDRSRRLASRERVGKRQDLSRAGRAGGVRARTIGELDFSVGVIRWDRSKDLTTADEVNRDVWHCALKLRQDI